jgi:hypothetical protein
MEETSSHSGIDSTDFLQTVDNEITNSISLSDNLKGDSLTLIATIFALIGIIGISAIKELLLIWVASSFVLLTLIFLKILKDFFPTNKKQKDIETVFSAIGENRSQTIFLQMMGAILFNNLKPLYKSLILIFITDLLIFFISFAGLIKVADLGLWIFISIVIVLLVLTIFSSNLAKFGSFSMEYIGKMATVDKERKSDKGKSFFKKSAKVTFILLIIPFLLLIFILIKINDVIPFFDNHYSNLGKICFLIVIQVFFIAIFSEFFNKQMVSQILSKKIALLNTTKLLIFSRDSDPDKKKQNSEIRYLFNSCNLLVIRKEPSFFFFEKNSVYINMGAIRTSTEEDLPKLLNDELNFYLTP